MHVVGLSETAAHDISQRGDREGGPVGGRLWRGCSSRLDASFARAGDPPLPRAARAGALWTKPVLSRDRAVPHLQCLQSLGGQSPVSRRPADHAGARHAAAGTYFSICNGERGWYRCRRPLDKVRSMLDPNNRPGGPNLIVTAKNANKVQFFDAGTLARTGEIDMPASTHEMVLSPEGGKVFASVYGGGDFRQEFKSRPAHRDHRTEDEIARTHDRCRRRCRAAQRDDG